MKTVILEEPGTLRLVDTPEPGSPGPEEALVRVHRVGICGTDLHAYRGKQPFFSYPRILGHELGVEIVAVGSAVEDRWPGQNCAVEPYLNCGNCIACRRGKTNCCAALQVLGVHTDGGMRDYLRVPAHKLHPSETLSLEQLALVETLGIGAHAVDRAQVTPGESILVLGSGPIGLSVVPFAQVAGARVLVADINPDRLAFCREQFSVDHTLQIDEDAVEAVRSLTEGDLPTVVFDATGNAHSMAGAFRFVAPGGKLVFVGLVQAEISFSDPEFHRKEMTLLATRNATGADFRRILALLESGAVDTTPWITHRAAVSALLDAFPSWLNPESHVIKAMAEF